MEIITLIYLSGAITGSIVGETFKPYSLPIDGANENKQCTVHTVTDKQFNFEINDYIENVKITEICNTQTKEETNNALHDRWKKRLQKGTSLGKKE